LRPYAIIAGPTVIQRRETKTVTETSVNCSNTENTCFDLCQELYQYHSWRWVIFLHYQISKDTDKKRNKIICWMLPYLASLWKIVTQRQTTSGKTISIIQVHWRNEVIDMLVHRNMENILQTFCIPCQHVTQLCKTVTRKGIVSFFMNRKLHAFAMAMQESISYSCTRQNSPWHTYSLYMIKNTG
jgi:hypothetical protein